MAKANDTVLYAVGLADGRIRLRNEAGQVTVEVKIPGRVYALCALDLDNDGNDEIIAGSDTGGIRAFTADGTQLWTWMPPSWKRPSNARSYSKYRTVITSIIPADVTGDGKPEILAVGIAWYILDREGKMISIHEIPTSGKNVDAIVPEYIFTLAVGDFIGDGADEIVGDWAGVGDSGGTRKIRLWDMKKERRRKARPSNRFCGSALKVVVAADFDGDGKDEFAIASDAYKLQVGYYDIFGSNKQGIWSCNVGSGANAMIAANIEGNRKYAIIVGTEMGQVQAFNAEKKRLFIADVEESVTALAARHVAGQEEICVGTVNGKLLVLNARGRIIRRGYLPGLIDHLVVSKDGKILATTSGGQVALYTVFD